MFEVIEPLDISLDDFPTSPGTGTRYGIAHLYNGSQQTGHLRLVMVSSDGITDLGLLFVFFGQLHA